MVAFFGPGVAGVVLAIAALRNWEQPEATYWLLGGLLYLIGTIGVTIAGNIPLNDALAVANPNTAESAAFWSKYLTDWTFWNHVRTAAALLAAAAFSYSFRL